MNKLTGDKLRVAVDEEIPFAYEELGENPSLSSLVKYMKNRLIEAGFSSNTEELKTILSTYVEDSVNESIYEQMNNIDDNESLNEKYNVESLKDVKRVHEAAENEQKNTLKKSMLVESPPIGSNDGSELSFSHDGKVVYETVRHIVNNKDNEEYPNPVTEAINHVRRNLKIDIEQNAAHWGYNNTSIKQLISNYKLAIKLIEDNFEGVTEQVNQLRDLLKQLQDTYNKNKR